MIALTSPSLPRTAAPSTRTPHHPGAAARALDTTGRLLVVAAARLATATAARDERRARRAATTTARSEQLRTADELRRDNAAQVHPLGLR
ncbi:hypothetical protein ATJ88_2900 [Isoptericola jiangsuensis]|uniref:Uncharacterized protein n=1 Tax=Isoptericola jiangsuensis TaxID=548579 RepID=A0A2A9F0W0_9MICO|nr:hypothetical protein [Isoptericola jiangsuensis]PFG44182.1 hypothetical protein ATJ88_2900 [Isoptericola jiangsuensis]